MKKTFIGIILVHLISCNNSTIKLKSMPYAIIEFQNLPIGVKNYIINPETGVIWKNKAFVLLNPSDTNLYEFNSHQSSLAPWIYHESVTQLTSGITYHIETQTPIPYFLYGDTLLIPCQYNIHLYDSNLNEITFKKYVFRSRQ